MSDFRVDFDALFTEQVLKENDSNEQFKRGNRIRARKTSLTHGKSFAKLSGAHIGLNSFEVSTYENSEMLQAEKEQTQTDKFWGLDKESKDKSNEISLMSKEEVYSAAHELYCKTENMQKLWEEEEIYWAERVAIENKKEEENACMTYLRDFYSSTNSGYIMNYKWPTKVSYQDNSNTSALNDSKKVQGFEIWNLVGEPSTIHLDGLQQSRTISLNGDTYDPRKTASIADLAMRPAGTRKNKPSHHQQQQNNNNIGNNNNSFNQTVNSNLHSVDSFSPFPSISSPNTPNLQQQQQSQSQLQYQNKSNQNQNHSFNSIPFSAQSSPSKANMTQKTKLNLLELNNAKYLAESNKLLLSESQPKYSEFLDGHPLYHWDSYELIKLAFNQLDVLGAGYLRRENISELGNNRTIHQYLRYTLFWMSLKKRKWNFFYSMFDDLEETITVDTWLAILELIRYEERVKIRHIRTMDEHRSYSTLNYISEICESGGNVGVGNVGNVGGGGGNWSDFLGENVPKLEKLKYASQQRQKVYSLERDAFLLRSLERGDFVWGLYGKGCVWLPAIIEDIDLNKKEYKLKYLLNTDEVRQNQTRTYNRQYLPQGLRKNENISSAQNTISTIENDSILLNDGNSINTNINNTKNGSIPNNVYNDKNDSNNYPNNQNNQNNNNNNNIHQIILPKSIKTEKDLCSYVYDLIDKDGSGRLDSQYIINELQTPRYQQVIILSSYLTSLFKSNYKIYEVMISMYPSSNGNNEDEDEERGITKSEFIELCQIANDIIVYNPYSQ